MINNQFLHTFYRETEKTHKSLLICSLFVSEQVIRSHIRILINQRPVLDGPYKIPAEHPGIGGINKTLANPSGTTVVLHQATSGQSWTPLSRPAWRCRTEAAEGISLDPAEFSWEKNSHNQMFSLKTSQTFEISFHPEMHHNVLLVLAASPPPPPPPNGGGRELHDLRRERKTVGGRRGRTSAPHTTALQSSGCCQS